MAFRVGCRHLRTDPGLAEWHDRKREANDVYTMTQKTLGELGRKLCIAQHHRDDRMFTGYERESGGSHLRTEVQCVLLQPAAQLRIGFEQIDDAQARRRDERRDAVRKEIWP